MRQRPQTATRNFEKVTLGESSRIDDLFTIQSKRTSRATTPNKSSVTAATHRKSLRVVNSKSLVRSIEKFNRNVENSQFQPVPLTHRITSFRP
jgi:hypothetical protein